MANVTTSIVFLVSLIFYVNFVASSIHNIKLDNGQIFKCVVLHKQPAFRNSLPDLQVVSNLTKLQDQESVSGLGLESHKCPIGTVPILDRSKLNSTRTPYHQLALKAKKPYCSALVRTTHRGYKKKFFGAGGAICVYKLFVLKNQWSTSRIRLSYGLTESIEAGWMTNPDEFNDSDPHLYASFNVNGKGCINLACPGFVQVSNQFPLGARPKDYSNDKHQAGVDIKIAKLDDGNWWLSIKGGAHKIGYWPKTLFSSLKDFATQVDFGGAIGNQFGLDPPPPMGNGVKAVYDTRVASYIARATVINEESSTVEPPDTEKYASCSELYTVKDAGTIPKQDDAGRLIYFGGPTFVLPPP